MTLQEQLKKLYVPFTEIDDCDVMHFLRVGSPPYIVWAEDGEMTSFHADNHKGEQQLTGTVDLFTKTEFDPIADEIQKILNEEEVGWRLDSVQYEPETNLIHYSWRWYVG